VHAAGRVRIAGSGADRNVVRTRSGYGILALDTDLVLEDLTITGGARDPDPRATDAAVVAKRSRVRIERCRIADNLGDPAVVGRTVVGIIGAAGREGSDLTVHSSEIVHNSWDGVALYHGARATVEDSLVDGVDPCRGGGLCGGRGVGIGVTWDAKATLRGNLVTRYWKGIGAFLDADVVVEDNVVEDVLTWGIAVWEGEGGRPRAVVRRNAVHHTGACGIVVARAAPPPPEPGELAGNAVTRSGLDPAFDRGEPYCPQRAIAFDPRPVCLRLAGNFLFANREPGDCPGSEDVESPTSTRSAPRWPAGAGRAPRHSRC
jgi:hypothetical protein